MTMNIVDAIIGLRRALARAASATFTGDVTAKQAAVLHELRASGPVSQIALARSIASDPAFLVRVLDDLEERGLVNRQRSQTDRRAMAVSLTPRGLKALGPLDAALQALAGAAEVNLTRAEQRTFVALATRIIISLESVTDDESAPTADLRRG